MTDKECAEQIRRGLLTIVSALEKKFAITTRQQDPK